MENLENEMKPLIDYIFKKINQSIKKYYKRHLRTNNIIKLRRQRWQDKKENEGTESSW